MKKTIILLIILMIMLAGCGSKDESTSVLDDANAEAVVTEASVDKPSSEVVEIGEKMFTEQVNDIYYNPDEYLGKTIKYEGVFETQEFEDSTQNYSAVFRYGPGCCGDDGLVGFEVVWDKEYPKQDDWVEVVGVLVNNEEGGYQRLQLLLDELTVLPTRGKENVTK